MTPTVALRCREGLSAEVECMSSESAVSGTNVRVDVMAGCNAMYVY